MKREKSVIEQALDPRRTNLGNLGVALKAAAEKKDGKS